MPEETVVTGTTPETPPDVQTTVTDPAPAYDWRTDIHPDVKEDKVWESVKDIKGLTKAYADAAKYNVGALKLPAPDAPAEEWGKVYDKLGRPAAPEGYEIHESDPGAAEFSALRGVAHVAGLSAKQWAALKEGYGRIHAEQASASKEEARTVTAALREEWGGAFDKKMGLAQQAIKLGGEDLWAEIGKSPLGNHPAFIKWVAMLGETLAEESIISGQVPDVQDKDSAKAELDTLTRSAAYLKASDPGHKAAVERATKLFQLVYN